MKSSTVIAVMASVLLMGCVEQPIRSCDEIEREVIGMERGRLIKITGARVTSRTDGELICHGTAIYRDNTEIVMRYRVYRDEDDEEMIAFDTDEADVAREVAEQREAKLEMEAAVGDVMQDFDQHMRDNIPPGTWERMQRDAAPTDY